MEKLKIDKKRKIAYNDNVEMDAVECFNRGKAACDSGNFEEGMEWYTYSSEIGGTGAMCNLALMYFMGQTSKGVDNAKGIALLKKAAAAGDTRGKFNLAMCYENGIGVDRNSSKAFEYLKESANGGFRDAQYLLGVFYYRGIGVTKDFDEAAEWFGYAAKAGHPEAQYNYGVCFCNGEGVKRSYTTCIDWFTASANNGNVLAQFTLGDIYETGKLEQKIDYIKAITFYTLAAKRGNKEAEAALPRVRAAYEEKMKAEAEEAAQAIKASEESPENAGILAEIAEIEESLKKTAAKKKKADDTAAKKTTRKKKTETVEE